MANRFVRSVDYYKLWACGNSAGDVVKHLGSDVLKSSDPTLTTVFIINEQAKIKAKMLDSCVQIAENGCSQWREPLAISRAQQRR
jgi:hypothetical protein